MGKSSSHWGHWQRIPEMELKTFTIQDLNGRRKAGHSFPPKYWKSTLKGPQLRQILFPEMASFQEL
jgi:hypothetical protein